MKTLLLVLPIACLLAGCAESKRQSGEAAAFSPLPAPSTPTVTHIETPPRGDPPPWVWIGKKHFRNPGRYTWTNGMTLTAAIQAAGGFTNRATHHNLSLTHWDGSLELYKFSQGSVYDAYGNPTNNPTLRPGDGLSVVVY